MTTCAWCGQPFAPNSLGRPRVYCSTACRRRHGRYTEALPAWTARLAELDAAAAGYRAVPTFLRNELAGLRGLIARGPADSARAGRPSASNGSAPAPASAAPYPRKRFRRSDHD
jgi:hypothetical protein